MELLTLIGLIFLAWLSYRAVKKIRNGLDRIERRIEDRKLSVEVLRHDQEKAQKKLAEKIEKIQAIRDGAVSGDDYDARVQREIEELTK